MPPVARVSGYQTGGTDRCWDPQRGTKGNINDRWSGYQANRAALWCCYLPCIHKKSFRQRPPGDAGSHKPFNISASTTVSLSTKITSTSVKKCPYLAQEDIPSPHPAMNIIWTWYIASLVQKAGCNGKGVIQLNSSIWLEDPRMITFRWRRVDAASLNPSYQLALHSYRGRWGDSCQLPCCLLPMPPKARDPWGDVQAPSC